MMAHHHTKSSLSAWPAVVLGVSSVICGVLFVHLVAVTGWDGLAEQPANALTLAAAAILSGIASVRLSQR